MHTPLILKLSAAILFGGCHFGHAAVDERRPETRAGKRAKSSTTVTVKASRRGENGSVIFNELEVWSGQVRDRLRSAADSIDGTECAAAWDGDRVVWENVEGAAEKLRDRLGKPHPPSPK